MSEQNHNETDIVTTYEYDQATNALTKIVRPDGTNILYTYDSKNRLIRTKIKDAILA